MLVILFILLVILFSIAVYYFEVYNKKSNLNDNNIIIENYKNNYINNPKKSTKVKKHITHKDILKNYVFHKMQYNPQFWDSIQVFKGMDIERIDFNIADLPVSTNEFHNDKNPNMYSNAKKLMDDFITNTNNNINTLKTPNTIKSGWDIQMEKLGIDTNLYPQSKTKGYIKLIKILNIETYEVDLENGTYEYKYVIYSIIKKKNVNDLMAVKVSFILKNKHNNKIKDEERTFFDNLHKKNNQIDFILDDTYNIFIQNISILGYYTLDSNISKNNEDVEDLYDFNKDKKMNDADISRFIQKKNKSKDIEMKNLNKIILPK